MSDARFSGVVAVVPVRSLAGAKSRLGEPLDPEERADLVLALLRRVVAAGRDSARVTRVAVVSPDPDLLAEARALGAVVVRQSGEGLNEGLSEARAELGAEPDGDGPPPALLVLPADLPGASAGAIDGLIAAAEKVAAASPECALVALVPDRHQTGTNALLLSPPDAIEFRFGPGSRAAHAAEAARAGAVYFEIGGPLTFDLDTPQDLLEADLQGLDHEAGR